MAKAGLSFQNPLLAATGYDMRNALDPRGYMTPASNIGLGGVQDSLADMAVEGERLSNLGESQFTMPGLTTPARPRSMQPDIGFNESTREFFVQGATFGEDDYTSALEATQRIGQQPTGQLPQGFRRIPVEGYAQFIQSIEDPSTGRLFSRNIDIGLQNLKQIGGAALSFAGAEETGGRFMGEAQEELDKLAPFQRQFTDVENADELGDWFVANFAQQVPNILESVAAGLAGAAVGTAAAGPVGTVGGFFAGLLGKQGVKQAVQQIVRKKAAGQPITAAEKKLLNKVGAATGATIATVGSNYAFGIGDIYGEQLEAGAPDRAATALSAIPYAGLESALDLFIGSRLLGGARGTNLADIPSTRGKALEVGKRAGAGFGVGGVLEGITEAAQEAILVANNPDVDFDSPEAIDRFINSFAAGVGVGGPISATANTFASRPKIDTNLQEGRPTDLLTEGNDPTAASQPDLFEGTEFGPQAGPVALENTLTPTVVPGERRQSQLDMFGFEPTELATGIPAELPGEQGVLNLFPDATRAELQARMQPTVEQAAPVEAVPPVVDPRQGALQFAPPAPESDVQARNALRSALETALARRRDMDLIGQAQQEAEAQRQQELTAIQREATSQQQLGIAEAAERVEQPAVAEQPIPAFVPSGPQQGALDLRRGRLTKAQRKAGAKQLRRALKSAQEPAPVAPTPAESRAAGQGILFTQRGEPAAQALTPEAAAERQSEQLNEQLRQAFAEQQAAQQAEQETRAAARLRRGRARPAPAPVVEAAPVVEPTVEAVAEPAPTPEVTPDATQERQQPARRQLQRGRVDEEVQQDGADRVGQAPVQEEGARASRGDSLRRGAAQQERVVTRIPRQRPVEADPVVAQPPTEEEIQQIVDEMSDDQILSENIDLAETTKSVREYKLALRNILEYATSTDTNIKNAGVDTRAQEFIADLPKDETLKDVIKEYAGSLGSFDATFTKGNSKGELTYLFRLILDNSLLVPVMRKAKIRALPDEYKANEKSVSGPKTTTPDVDEDARSNPEKTLADLITEINRRDYNTNKPQQANLIAQMKDLYANVEDEFFVLEDGTLLGDYFTTTGNPKTQTLAGPFRVVTEKLNKQEKQAYEADLRAEAEALRAIENDTLTLDDWNMYGIDVTDNGNLDDGRFFTEDGDPIRKRLPVGKQKLVISNFVRRLKRAPKVFTYRNQEDMRAKNPSLYEEAVLARPQGDFDVAPAVGYSFGDGNVVIFTDRVVTEKQLKFVLAHETLGHFGFRGLLSEAQLKAALNKIYDESAVIRDMADAASEARGIPKLEATEEALADMAGSLDTNVVARFWNLIKNFLNKIGIQFEDDYARYLLDQSRRYVRNGQTSGNMFIPGATMERLKQIERMQDPDGTGRFSLQHYDDLGRIAGAYNNMGENGGITGASDFFYKLKEQGVNLKDFGEKVLSELKTMNFSARDNFGYRELFRILRDTVQKVNILRNKYNHMMSTALRPAGEVAGFQFTGGATQQEIDQANQMLSVTSRVKINMSESVLRKLPNLVEFVNGEARINQTAFDQLSAMGRFTLADFKKGIKYTIQVTRPMDDAGRRMLEAEKQAELAKAVDNKDRASIERQYDRLLEAESYLAEVEQEFPAIPDLTEDSNVWKVYNEVRDTMDQAAVDILISNYAAAAGERTRVRGRVQRALGRELTEADDTFLQTVEAKFLELRNEGATQDNRGTTVYKPESVQKANEFMAAFNAAIIGKDTDRNAAVAAYFPENQRDDVSTSVNNFKLDAKIKEADRFKIQQDIQNLALFEMSKTDAEMYAKRTIAGGYVPFGREGEWQVRMVAQDPTTGQIYKISEHYMQSLPYFQVDNRAEAEALAGRVTDLFDLEDGVKLEVLVGDTYKVVPVKLFAEASAARQEQSVNTETNLNEVISILSRFSVNITPEERERLIVGLTSQNARMRARLERAGVPGEDKNVLKYVSQHLEGVASTVARKENRHRLDVLFEEDNPESIKLWFGDEARYEQLKAEYERLRDDNTATEAQKKAAKRAFEDYHFVFKVKESRKNGNKFRDRAVRSVAFLESQRSIEYSDFGSGDAASLLKMGTVFAQLGGSVATAALNIVALPTNFIPAMASYNERNGFGGGFGLVEVSTTLSRSMADVGGLNRDDSEYYAGLLADPEKLAASGLDATEARFMRDQIAQGTFQAALFNSLLGSARGRVTSGLGQKAMNTWMGMFSFTEQSSRRAAGLTAFRKQYARLVAEGKTAEEAFESATDFAVDMVEQTLGEYAMFNRPSFFRGDVRQFIFMYKMFVVTSIQMLSAMDRQGKLIMLAVLMALSGIKGLPFADDLFDLVDTIAQALGLSLGSAEKELAEMLDAIVPGATPILMRGFIDNFFPATISSRVSLADMIPGTGIALAGSNMGDELISIAGPAASMIEGSLGLAANVLKLGAGAVGLTPQETSIVSVMREAPITIIRALGDAMSYSDTGAVTNRKGYVVSEDLHAGVIISRILGFYPSAATRENDVVRLSKRIADYGRDVSASFRVAAVKAQLTGDRNGYRNVLKSVNEWNKAAKGTGLEIRNFQQSVNQALREARRPAAARYMKSAPKNVRPESEMLLKLYGVE